MNFNINFLAQKASTALFRLLKVAQELLEGINKAANFVTPPDSDERLTLNENVYFDASVSDQPELEKTLKTIKNFNYEQFRFQLEIVEPVKRPALYSGPGRKCQDTVQNFLFMLLVNLKQGGEWSIIASMFKKLLAHSNI